MEHRIQGINEIIARFRANKTDLGLKFFKDSPSGEIDPDKVPAIIIQPGLDQIVSRSGRNPEGYPAKRVLELTIECIINSKETNISSFYLDARRVAFIERGSDPEVVNVQVAPGVFINENRTEGPFGYGLPNIIGMRLVLDMIYNDEGLNI